MSLPDREPTPDELLLMAYVDDELAADARAAFEQRLARQPELRREVTHLRRIELLARHAAPAEPADHEWATLEREWLHRSGFGLGFLALGLGCLGLLGWAVWALTVSDLELLPKGLSLLALAGLLVLFLVTLRARLRTLPYDPYTEVER